MQYRPEIDGLRALAVLPVILYHAGFEAFSGGYVGVDVFFVISGYLITTIIISELDAGKFSLVNFYERRARRILPALFFVMAACIPFALIWLIPLNELKDFGASLIAVSTFTSNILFWSEKGGYFGTASELKPLLHTWSLAVEEQYYILFPLFLMYTWHKGLRWVVACLTMVFLLSLALAIWGSQQAARPSVLSGAFFLIPTRVWELLVGVFIALYLKDNTYLKSRTTNQVLSLLGLAMVAYSIVAFDDSIPFPSAYTLVPVLGTGLIVLSAVKSTLAHNLLSLKLLVGIGLISYSAYLWHQPILAFSRHISIGSQLSTLTLLALCLGSLVIGWLSWRFVEKPFRNKQQFNRSQIFVLSGVMAAAFISIGLHFHFNDGYANGLHPNVQLDNLQINSKSCTFEFITGFDPQELDECLAAADVFLVGDSHSMSLSYALSKELQSMGKQLTVLSHFGCFPIKGVTRRNERKSCAPFLDFLHQSVFVNNNRVVLSARWRFHTVGTPYNNGEGGVEFQDSAQVYSLDPSKTNDIAGVVEERIRQIDESTDLVVINQIPEVGVHVRKWFFTSEDPLSHSYTEYQRQNNAIHQVFTNIEGLKVVHTDRLVCSEDTQRCSTRLESGELLYFDDDHPSVHFSSMIAEQIVPLYFGDQE